MDQGLHGLVGGLVGLGQGHPHRRVVGVQALGVGDGLVAPRPLVLRQPAAKALAVGRLLRHGEGLGPQFLLHRRHQGGGVILAHPEPEGDVKGQGLKILLAEGLFHPRGHGVIEVRHRLAAVHLVLVGLDGDAAQGGVAADAVGLPQAAVAGGKAVPEQPQQVDLAAGLGEHVEVLVVDVDIPVDMCRRHVLGQDVVVDKILGALGTVLEHGAHGGISVDVGVFPLDVGVLGVGEGEFLVDLHQVAFRLADLGVLRPVEDVGLGGAGEALPDQFLLHQVLDLLHGGGPPPGDGRHHGGGEVVQALFGKFFFRHGVPGLADGLPYLDGVEGYRLPVALLDGLGPRRLFGRLGGLPALLRGGFILPPASFPGHKKTSS